MRGSATCNYVPIKLSPVTCDITQERTCWSRQAVKRIARSRMANAKIRLESSSSTGSKLTLRLRYATDDQTRCGKSHDAIASGEWTHPNWKCFEKLLLFANLPFIFVILVEFLHDKSEVMLRLIGLETSCGIQPGRPNQKCWSYEGSKFVDSSLFHCPCTRGTEPWP
ncbi:hypothetical protein RRG08_024076 [Elysia crispata]|uniref:Uncharacterized protein n=1 Tax=Elysia crispata TaxID=231223 RepID=A0AAE1DJG2_9GAST|nr:hypothetical protein RRG08_024076 [Elysia crispata]